LHRVEEGRGRVPQAGQLLDWCVGSRSLGVHRDRAGALDSCAPVGERRIRVSMQSF
jgi:hypothetical protein